MDIVGITKFYLIIGFGAIRPCGLMFTTESQGSSSQVDTFKITGFYLLLSSGRSGSDIGSIVIQILERGFVNIKR